MTFFKTGVIAVGATLLFGFSGSSLSAQSLTDALISAYRNSSQLQIDRAGLRSTDEGVAQAVAATRPSVSASVGRTGSYLVPVALSDYTTFSSTLSLSATMTLWDGGSNKLAIEVARLNVSAARKNLVNSEQTVLLNAVTAFMDMRRNQQFLELAENNQEVLQRQVQAARDRFEVGEVRRTDVSLAEAALAAAQAAVAQAQGNLEISRESYHLAVGVYPGMLRQPPAPPSIPTTLAAAKAIAMRTHPLILRAQDLAKTGDLNVARAERAVLPKLTLSGTFSDSGGSKTATAIQNSASVSIGASSTIYAGGALTSAYRQAIALKEQAFASLQLTGKSVDQAVTVSWAQIKIAKASIIAKQKQVRASRSALQGIREEADLGALTTLDILNAEQDLVQAESNLVSAQHDHYVAVYSLLSSMGLLTVKHLQLGIKTYDTDENYKKVYLAPGPTNRGKLLEKILTRAGKK